MPERYGYTSQALHWIMFLLIAAAFGVGLWMAGLPIGQQRFRAVPWHKAIGILILATLVLRILWRWRHPAPALPVSMPAWERRAAQASHLLLYLLMFAVPLSGWMMSSALGFSTVVFGWTLPNLLERDRELGDALKSLHYVLNKTLLALVALHVAAALKHAFIDRDGVLQRMLPARSRRLETP